MDAMSEHAVLDPVRAILSDAFDRVAEQVDAVATDLSVDDAVWRPDPDANSIAWLLWHLTRVQDDHVAGLAGTEQVWTSQGFYDRFGLPFEPTSHGYGHSSEDVAQVRTPPAELAEYHRAVREATGRYLETLTPAELDRVVDTSWDPPVTVAVRLVSVIDDCGEHVGQAAYVKGLAQRRGRTSA
jgi:hypothetical protein